MSPVLSCALSRRYDEGQPASCSALSSVPVVAAGELVAVMGPSGSASRRCATLAGGLDRPTGGRVLVDGQDLCRACGASARRAGTAPRIGYVFQRLKPDPTCPPWRTSCSRSSSTASLRGQPGAAARRSRRPASPGATSRHPEELSGGERSVWRSRVGGRRRASLLLADEPTGALAPSPARRSSNCSARAATPALRSYPRHARAALRGLGRSLVFLATAASSQAGAARAPRRSRDGHDARAGNTRLDAPRMARAAPRWRRSLLVIALVGCRRRPDRRAVSVAYVDANQTGAATLMAAADAPRRVPGPDVRSADVCATSPRAAALAAGARARGVLPGVRGSERVRRADRPADRRSADRRMTRLLHGSRAGRPRRVAAATTSSRPRLRVGERLVATAWGYAR